MVKKITRELLGWLVMGPAVLAVFIGLEYSFYRLAPMTIWVQYYAVEPLNELVKPLGEQHFVSDRIIKRKALLEWSDILYCDIGNKNMGGDGFEYYGEYRSSHYVTSKLGQRVSSPWRYGLLMPARESSCYLDSTTTLKLKYGVQKRQHLLSGVFLVGW